MAFINPNFEASHYHSDGENVVCDLCPHRCVLPPEKFGICKSRKNADGKLVAYNYGRISSLAVDPIEKKPLYHYHPGTSIFSVGGIGCNLHCNYCQNYSISQSPIGKKRTTYKSPSDLVALCRQQGLSQIAFTYNEPMVWFEYIMDIAKIAPELNIVLQTNGWVNDGPLKELCSVVDAMSIDIKAFDRALCKEICDGELKDVMINTHTVIEKGVHVELNYLVIPGINDSDEMITAFCKWVNKELSEDIPVHFSRFQPDYEMRDVPMTPVDSLLHCRDIGMECGLNFVYVGNTLLDDADDTICPKCGEVTIKRLGYSANIVAMDGGKCARCGCSLNIIR